MTERSDVLRFLPPYVDRSGVVRKQKVVQPRQRERLSKKERVVPRIMFYRSNDGIVQWWNDLVVDVPFISPFFSWKKERYTKSFQVTSESELTPIFE